MAFAGGTASQAPTSVPAEPLATTRGRRRAGGVIIFTALALIAGLVFVAVGAEGRELSRATSNDGGAWLVNRGLSVVAHRNQATGELSSHVRVTDSPTADVFQAGDLVVVHDPSTNQLFEVDTRSFVEDLEPTQLPEFSTVMATDQALIIARAEPLAVWRISQGQLPGVASLDQIDPLLSSIGSGRVATAPDGRVVAIDNETRELTWIMSDGELLPAVELDLGSEAIDVTIVEASAVVLTADGDLFVVGSSDVEHVVRWQDQTVSGSTPVRLQQSSVTINSYGPTRATSVALVTADGELIQVTLTNDGVDVRMVGAMAGTQPTAPIVFEGCVYGVTTVPPTFGVACEDFRSQLLESAGPNLRLRLVNGWVLVNDVDSGTAYSTDENLNLERFDDWGPAEELAVEDELEDDTAAGDTDQSDGPLIDDPDADGSVQDSDDFDPSEANVPPVAIDDIARTRVDRAVVVSVLDNDSDANNDILVVTGIESISGDARINITPAADAVQVTPSPGFRGTVSLRYSISDGKSEPVSALVTVEVFPIDATNRPPLAVTDVIATAPGHTTTVDVLRNDSDPDGDAIALAGIETQTGNLRWDPIGQVTFTPDITTEAGWIELPYIVVDDLGLQAEGLLRVEIRDDGSNQEPDARNDQATTITGRAVVIDLLANDSDPDGDPLIVGSQPRLLDPLDAVVQTSTTSDGEFVFRSDVAGTYLFSYTVNDAAPSGSESDTARIRVDVLPAGQNQPPVAVRDDVVIAVGETRTVFALANDGDPDGDLVSIVDWQTSPGLQVTEFTDGSGHVGFQITVEPGQTGQPTMTYWISDGVNDPVSAPIVVAVVQRTATDQAPFANDDVIEARAGSVVTGVPVLANDFDPEGGPLRVVRVGDAPAATVAIGDNRQTVDLELAEDIVSSFSVPYDIEDEAGNRAAAVLRVQLINADAPNRPPIARTDDARTKRGEAILIDVLRNDSDPDSDVIALEAINAQPANGIAEITAQGAVRYQPNPEFAGTDVLRYSIVDSQGDRAIGDVFIGVQEEIDANLPPIANDDSYTLAGVPSTTPLDVIANDFDPEGDPLRVVDVTSPNVGTVSLDDFGRVAYTPPLSLAEAVAAVFDYVIVDTAGNPARATVTVELEAFEEREEPTPAPLEVPATPTPVPTIEPVVTATATPEPTPTPVLPLDRENVPPIAVNDERGPVVAGSEVIVAVLENDRDPDGERSDLRIVGVGDGGQISGDNVIITVDEETVTIPYTIEDAAGAPASATITVVVVANEGPTVIGLEVSTAYETPIDIDVSGQAIDPDSDELFFVCCEDIRGGAVANVVTAANTFRLTFTPDDSFIGQAGFNYRVDDQKGHQVSGSVLVNVADPLNREPSTIADTVLIPQGETVTVDLSTLASDPDGDQLTYSLLSQPGGGVSVQVGGSTASVAVDRSVAIGDAGQFTYEVSDGTLSATGSVRIEISEGANRAPVALDSAVEMPAASSTTLDLATLANELDPGDSLVYELIDGVQGSSALTAGLSGSVLQLAAAANATGTSLPITYQVTDSRGASDTAIVTVTVVDPTSPDPSATDDVGETERNGAVTLDVLANDSDPLGQGLTLDTVSAPWGTAVITIANELRFLPGDRVGTVDVTYTLRDQADREAIGTATIETIGAPDQPAPPSVTRGSTEVDITWDEPADNGRTIDGYRIFSSRDTVPEIVGRQNSFTWTGLTNGLDYTFTIVAFNSVGDSDPSDPSPSVTPDELPEIPAPPVATRGDTELDVVWVEPTNLGSPIDRYELQIGPLQVPPVTVIGRLDHTWEGLTNGDFYTFTVRAHNDAGWTDWSGPSEERRPSAPPDAPTIGTTTRGTQSAALTVNWTNSGTNGAQPIEYEIDSSVAAAGGPVTESDPAARSYDWSNLPTGEDMTFRVRARNEAGWSLWSADSNTMQACGVPGLATNIVPTRGDGEAGLTWTAPPDVQDCGVQNYIIQAYDNGVLHATQNSTTTDHDFTSLTNGDEYRFTVTATNVIGSGGESLPSPPVTPAGPPICQTSLLSFNASVDAPREIDLSWSSLAANNGDPIIDYEIDRGSGYQSLGGTSESTSFGSLSDGTTYDFDIRAVNGVGESLRCASTSATTWALPTAVSAAGVFDGNVAVEELTVTASGGTSSGVPGTTWTIGLQLNGSEIVAPAGGNGNANGQTRVFPIAADGSYTAVVAACNQAGCTQGTSAPIDITLAAPPDQMTAAEIALSSTLDPTGMRISVDFTAPNNNGDDVTVYRYDVRRSQPNVSGWWTVRENQSFAANQSSNVTTLNQAAFFEGYSAHPQGMNTGSAIEWQVRARARNAKGFGTWSDWVSITPPPPQPLLDFTVASAWNCTSPSTPTITTQCHDIRIHMYGFPPNRAYNFRSPMWPSDVFSANAAPQWQQNWPSNGLPIPRWEHHCTVGVPVVTDASGRVVGDSQFCTSALGSSVRLSTNDGYYSAWRTGVGG